MLDRGRIGIPSRKDDFRREIMNHIGRAGDWGPLAPQMTAAAQRWNWAVRDQEGSIKLFSLVSG
jgi:hypothetical protein